MVARSKVCAEQFSAGTRNTIGRLSADKREPAHIAAKNFRRPRDEGRLSDRLFAGVRRHSGAGETPWVRRQLCPALRVNPAGLSAFTAGLREGTTVKVYLPRAIKGASTGSAHRPDVRVAGGARVLVVDDDPDVRWITAEEFREIGCTVIEADSGHAALAMLERDEPCDLMVVDLMMPGLSGTDTV